MSGFGLWVVGCGLWVVGIRLSIGFNINSDFEQVRPLYIDTLLWNEFTKSNHVIWACIIMVSPCRR
jgi:hypothetical protein